MRCLLVASVVCLSLSPAFALPPDESGRGFVEGANHHLGDASFVAAFGRTPGDTDREKVRMRLHLEHVRAWLAGRPATRPELAGRRAELLGYLAEYIAAGVTPQNLDLPWRTPVFVDALGNVCAVGHLIERSVSRALVERIAARHRFDYLEDIALPEVKAWIDASGFTLEELASIQPGYVAPIIETWQTWDLQAQRPTDGPFELTTVGVTTRGRWRGGHMDGPWTRTDAAGRVIGRGELARGRGTWTSLDGDGRVIAEGPFVASHPNGKWRFLHPSGRLAATGRLARGQRVGHWTFYYDVEGAVPIAAGRFARGGRVTGTWRHHDPTGRVVATTWPDGEADWGEVLRMRLEPKDGLEHEIAEGNFGGDYQRVDALRFQGVSVFLDDGWEEDLVYDVDGRVLARSEAGWTRSGCGWDAAMRRAARRGDLGDVRTKLLALRRGERAAATSGQCPDGEALDAPTSGVLDRMLALSGAVRVPPPGFVRDLVLAEVPEDSEAPEINDLADILAASMTWYIEWPHVDGRFARVFATLPGHFPPDSFVEGVPEGEPLAVTIR